MSETITTGPLVTYTYPCAVCGERYSGIGPHCPPKEDTAPVSDSDSLYRIGKIAYETDVPDATIEGYWEAVALRVAAEVLADPRRWARELGLAEPVSSVVRAPQT